MQSFDLLTGLYIYLSLSLNTNTKIETAAYDHMVKRMVVKKENKKRKIKIEENEMMILYYCRSSEIE